MPRGLRGAAALAIVMTAVVGEARGAAPERGIDRPISVAARQVSGAPVKAIWGQSQVPAENQLAAATTEMLRSLRRFVRRIGKVIRNAAGRWLDWLVGLVAFSGLTLLAGIADREIIERWQSEGMRGLARAIALGSAVYLRLLRDWRTPLVGKLLLAFAAAYGVATADLIPDSRGWRGLTDDVLLVMLAARGFMRMCPDPIVEAHARAAAGRLAEVE